MGGGGRGALCQVKEGCLRRWSLREEEGLHTCMFIHLGIDTRSYFDVECRPCGCP